MSNDRKVLSLPLMVDREHKTDYYRDRASLTACFNSGLLNKDHSHITLNDQKGWKLDSSGKGFIEFDPLAPRGPEKYPGEHREYKFSEIMAAHRIKALGTTHPTKLFPGRRLFQLKATHGVPLEISLENLARASMVVEWVGFIEEARLSGWYDFQTLEVIQNALADVFDRDVQQAIILRIKKFILTNPMQV